MFPQTNTDCSISCDPANKMNKIHQVCLGTCSNDTSDTRKLLIGDVRIPGIHAIQVYERTFLQQNDPTQIMEHGLLNRK